MPDMTRFSQAAHGRAPRAPHPSVRARTARTRRHQPTIAANDGHVNIPRAFYAQPRVFRPTWCGALEASSLGGFGRTHRLGSPAHLRPAASGGVASVTDQEIQRFELDTRYAKASLRFDVRVESGRNVVFVSEVAIASPAYEEGIRAGMVLREISDPIRYSEVWELDDYCSLRYVRDAFRMRQSPTIIFGFTNPVPSQQTGRGSEALSGAVKEEQPKSSESTKSSSSDASPLRKTIESMDEMLGTDFVQDAGGNAGSGAAASAAAVAAVSTAQQESAAGIGDAGGPEQHGSNMEAAEAFARELSKSSKRIKRRKEYLDVVSDRDDSRFFAVVAACFFLPALIGLAAAQFSGYLDFLATRY